MRGRAASLRPALGVARTMLACGRGFRPSRSLQGRLRVPNLLQPLLLVRHPRGQFIPTTVLAPLRILASIESRCLLLPPLYRRGQFNLGVLHPAIAHRLMRRGIGLEFGTVTCHVPQCHQPRLLAQREHLREQIA